MSNCFPGASGKRDKTNVQDDQFAYDQLPSRVRQALREASFPMSAARVLQYLETGLSESVVIVSIREMDAKLAALNPPVIGP